MKLDKLTIKSREIVENAHSNASQQNHQALEKFDRDLTKLARKGKLDPVIGRDEEIRRI
ncbi:MAG: hypothetical protein KAI40_05415 [Desulfobacterales bacterium]|nr:hypothetical protein [Desulfobacterales bacterium]